MKRRHSLLLLAAVPVLVAGLATTAPAPLAQTQAPPPGQSPAPQQTPLGEFVWHDLVTANPAAGRAFYGALFGWEFEAAEGIDPGYTLIKHNGQPIGGIVQARREAAAIAQWLSYVVVADVDRSAKLFEQAGGRTFRGPLNLRKDLRVAVVSDAQGAPIGLASRRPDIVEPAGVPALHRWLWMEYVARDPMAALKFFGEAVGFSHELHTTRNAFTYYLLTTDRPRAGLFLSPWTSDMSAWLPYVRVADPAATAARAVELGGTVLLAPQPGIRNGSLAIVLDPAGAPLALQRYPFDEERATP